VALPLRNKLAYAASSLGSEALGQSRGLWLLFYYSDETQLLSVGVVGGLLTAARIVESFDDALVGWWSDRTRSRLGRRIPFILAATPLWALFGFLLFTPPDSGGVSAAVYLFLVLEAFFLFSTLSGGPYEALLPEIAPTSAERLTIVGMKVYLGALGGGIGLVVSGPLADHVSFQAMALTMAALALAARYVGLAGIWRYASRERPPTAESFRESLRLTFANTSFLRFLPSFVLFQIGFQMLVGTLPFFVNGVLGIEEEGDWVAALTATAIVTMVVSVPFFGLYARRTSKRQAYSRAMIGAAVLFPLPALAGLLPGVGDRLEIFVAMALVGIPLAGVYLFPATLTADIIDDETARTGLRREATYYCTQNFVEKTATAVAPLALALLLLVGRDEGDTLGIRLVGPAAGLVVLAGWLAFRSYDLPDEIETAPLRV
jgi:GPH family glycoside/pentoside/hexuronide:cation symporter